MQQIFRLYVFLNFYTLKYNYFLNLNVKWSFNFRIVKEKMYCNPEQSQKDEEISVIYLIRNQLKEEEKHNWKSKTFPRTIENFK